MQASSLNSEGTLGPGLRHEKGTMPAHIVIPETAEVAGETALSAEEVAVLAFLMVI